MWALLPFGGYGLHELARPLHSKRGLVYASGLRRSLKARRTRLREQDGVWLEILRNFSEKFLGRPCAKPRPSVSSRKVIFEKCILQKVF